MKPIKTCMAILPILMFTFPLSAGFDQVPPPLNLAAVDHLEPPHPDPLMNGGASSFFPLDGNASSLVEDIETDVGGIDTDSAQMDTAPSSFVQGLDSWDLSHSTLHILGQYFGVPETMAFLHNFNDPNSMLAYISSVGGLEAFVESVHTVGGYDNYIQVIASQENTGASVHAPFDFHQALTQLNQMGVLGGVIEQVLGELQVLYGPAPEGMSIEDAIAYVHAFAGASYLEAVLTNAIASFAPTSGNPHGDAGEISSMPHASDFPGGMNTSQTGEPTHGSFSFSQPGTPVKEMNSTQGAASGITTSEFSSGRRDASYFPDLCQ